ncbi:2OG-Fe(II) oxygenase [Variovorax terrae]|uniref:2OG-Fe(II) oxygenase n=1 Tax=Variovorax terrae TaxID=2923278 RepID=UPI002434C922|nr:2OG-Fe(II) oxygenase [Variovorax terrae]
MVRNHEARVAATLADSFRATVIAVHHQPVQGARGVYRANLRHGVSRVRLGRRHMAGIIFHDAA